MRKNWWFSAAVPLLLLCFSGCGDSGENGKAIIQQNTPSTFTLMEITKGEGALEEAWNEIDGAMVNDRIAETVNTHTPEFITFANSFHTLLDEKPTLMAEMLGTDTRGLLQTLMAPHPSHQTAKGVEALYGEEGATQYTQGFYSLLDDLSVDVPLTREGYANRILAKVLSYWLETESPQEFAADMQELIDDLTDEDFHEDFLDLSRIIGKLLVKSHYPMWRDDSGTLMNLADIDPDTHTNMGMGNIARGMRELANGFNEVMADETARLAVHRIIEGLGGIFDPANDNAAMLRAFLCEAEDRFTKGGAIYESDSRYNQNDAYIYSDAELSKNLREFFPYLMQYFLRADREMGLISDKFGKKTYPLEILGQNFERMGWDIENARIEESLYDLMRVDIWGRDRVNNPEAFHTSFLEGLMFFAALGAHMGYDDGGKTDEITGGADPNHDHGHGKYTGTLTLNDSLFAMGTHKAFKVGDLGMFGMYDLALKDDNDHYNYIFRSKYRYKAGSTKSQNYRFRYDKNYPIGRMVAGKPGDMGLPHTDDGNDNNDGGKPRLHGDGTPVLNGYTPYGASGKGDDDVALNSMSGTARAAWEAEGPFYYAEPSPDTVTFDGRIWSVYRTPGGHVYAWVYKNESNPETWEYLYPAQFDGQPMDDRAGLHVQYGKPTHALFTSEIDFGDSGIYNSYTGRRLTIRLGSAPHHEETILFNQRQNYTRDMVVTMVNNAFGETVCHPFDDNGKKLLQIVSQYGPIQLENNPAYNPISTFLKPDVDDSIDVPSEAFLVPEGGIISVEVDNNAPVEVNLTCASNTWTPAMIRKRLKDAGLNVLPFGYGLEIVGESQDFQVARVKATTVSGNAAQNFFKAYDRVASAFLNRYDRYSDTTRSDYYLGEHGGNYYTIAYDHDGNFTMPRVPMDEYAGSLIINESIKENDPRRLCTSQEEALFRNYQFFFADRKYLIIMPIHVSAIFTDSGMIFQIIETNGYAGFMNARKYLENQEWAKKRASGHSSVPGDYRLCVKAVGTAVIDEESIYNTTIDRGVSFNAVFPHNSAVITRMGFPTAGKINHGNDAEGNPIEDYLLSSTDFQVGDEVWQKRNAVLVILQALWGSLHTHTVNGYEGQVTRAGMRAFFDMMAYLLKPLFYYQKNEGNHPHQSWKPRIVGTDANPTIDPFLKRSSDFYSDSNPMQTWYGSDKERKFYQPAKLPTLITLLTDTAPYGAPPERMPSRCDGILAKLTEYDATTGDLPSTRLVTGLLQLIQRMGNTAFDDMSDPGTWIGPEELYAEWGPRRKILFGLEQLISAVRLTKSEGTIENDARAVDPFYNPVFADWIFSEGDIDAPTHLRESDLHLDWGLDLLIGEDATGDEEGRGLAGYPDDKETDEDWKDLTDLVQLLEALFNRKSKYCITDELIGLMDSTFAKPVPYDREDLKGALYSLGRLFARYDATEKRWVHQGDEGFDDLYRMLTLRLPEMHSIMNDKQGETYRATLILLADFLKAEGLVETLVDDVTIPSGWETIIRDLHTFLGKNKITQVSPLWTTVAALIKDLAHAVDIAQDISRMREVYDRYGLQLNQ